MKKTVLKNRKKMICDMISSREYVPMRAKEIAVLLQIPKARRKELEEVLEVLTEEGKIEADRRGRYRSCGGKKETAGYWRERFWVMQKASDSCLFRSCREKICIFRKSIRAELFIWTRWKQNFFRHQAEKERGAHYPRDGSRHPGAGGNVRAQRPFGFVTPDNPKISRDIYIPEEQCMDAQTGQKVVVQVRSYGDRRKSPEGAVTEILGYAGDAGVDVLSVARERGLR